MPAWCHTSGEYMGDPLSWRHFRYGMDRIRRSDAQLEHRITVATRTAQHADGEKFTQYLTDLRTLSGFTRS